MMMSKSSDYWLNDSINSEPSSSLWQSEQRQDSVLLQLEDTEQNVRIAVEREQEVENIVKSISELHDVFKVTFDAIFISLSKISNLWIILY